MKTYKALKTAMKNLHVELVAEVEKRARIIIKLTGEPYADLAAADRLIVHETLNDQDSVYISHVYTDKFGLLHPEIATGSTTLLESLENELLLELVQELDGMKEDIDRGRVE